MNATGNTCKADAERYSQTGNYGHVPYLCDDQVHKGHAPSVRGQAAERRYERRSLEP